MWKFPGHPGGGRAIVVHHVTRNKRELALSETFVPPKEILLSFSFSPYFVPNGFLLSHLHPRLKQLNKLVLYKWHAELWTKYLSRRKTGKKLKRNTTAILWSVTSLPLTSERENPFSVLHCLTKRAIWPEVGCHLKCILVPVGWQIEWHPGRDCYLLTS